MRSEVGQTPGCGQRASCGEPPALAIPDPRAAARGRGRGDGGAALRVAQRLAGPPALAWHFSGAKGGNPDPTEAFLRARHSMWAHHHYCGSRGVFGSSEHATAMTRFHRGLPVQELRGITSVSAGRPLFIPFLSIALDTPETARSSIHRALRAMARPGLEPGTPRFSVVRPAHLNSLDLQAIPWLLAQSRGSGLSRTLRSFPGGYGRRRHPSAFSPSRPTPAHGAGG
jgi:hypothetical protein